MLRRIRRPRTDAHFAYSTVTRKLRLSDWMKTNATKSVPLGGAFWDAGAQVFINKGVNGRWRDTLTPAEVAEYESRAIEELGRECAHWLKTGEDVDSANERMPRN